MPIESASFMPNPAEELRNQRQILNEVYGNQYDMVQRAAARRMSLDPVQAAPEGMARTIVAAVQGDERAAYAWLDNLTRAVHNELRRTQKGT